MSSLAAARADNFYYPPHFDPVKHKNLAGLTGQHPLRERAARLDQGILVIRFEVPFNIWCAKCGEMIAKGERFNADKKAVGNYLSTKIWSFSMRHHCGSNIVIQTDPRNAEYVIMEGARKKVEEYTSEAAGVIELADAKEKAALDDPFFRLEHGVEIKKRVVSATTLLAQLADGQDLRNQDPYTINKEMRAQMRSRKRADEALDAQREALGLSRGVKLLPAEQSDADNAALAFYQNDQAAHRKAQTHRQAILAQSIFAKPPAHASSRGGPERSASAPPRSDSRSDKWTAGATLYKGNGGKAGDAGSDAAVAQAVGLKEAGRPATEADLRPRNPHMHQPPGQQWDKQHMQQRHRQPQDQPTSQRSASTGSTAGASNVAAGPQRSGHAGLPKPAAVNVTAESYALNQGSSRVAAFSSSHSKAKVKVSVSLPASHSKPAKSRLGEVPASTFVAVPNTSSSGSHGRPPSSAGKRSVMDKAALMAKRQRLDPGIKLGLTQPVI